jgi:hypothetical protein
MRQVVKTSYRTEITLAAVLMSALMVLVLSIVEVLG